MVQNNPAQKYDDTLQNIEQNVQRLEKRANKVSPQTSGKTSAGLGSKLVQLAFTGAAIANTGMAVHWNPDHSNQIATPEPVRAPLVQTDNALDVAGKDIQFQLDRAQHFITTKAPEIQEAATTAVNGVSAIGLGGRGPSGWRMAQEAPRQWHKTSPGP